MQDQPTQQVPASVVVAGGKSFSVIFSDGTSAVAFVPLVPLRSAQRYLELQGDPNELIEEFIKCPISGNTENWTDSLNDDSLFALDAELRAINDPRIDRWLDRQAKVVEVLKPKMERMAKSGSMNS